MWKRATEIWVEREKRDTKLVKGKEELIHEFF